MAEKDSKETLPIFNQGELLGEERVYKLAMLVAQVAQGKTINDILWKRAGLLLMEAEMRLSNKWFEDKLSLLKLNKTLDEVRDELGKPNQPLAKSSIKRYLDAVYPNQPNPVKDFWDRARDGERVFLPKLIESFKEVRKNKLSERSKKGAETRRANSQKAVK